MFSYFKKIVEQLKNLQINFYPYGLYTTEAVVTSLNVILT